MERPFPAYDGTEPFIFVCYAHDDAGQVYPEISRLREVGFHIWYDEGISPGSEWSAALAERIQQCAVFLFFVTPRSVEREHCRREINFALNQRCTTLPVHLEPTDVPAALQLSLSHRQGILKYEHPASAYEAKLDQALEAAALGRSIASGAQPNRVLDIGDWRLDTGRQKLICADVEHPLEFKDMSVLLHLVEAAPDVVTTQVLLDRNWPGVVVGDNALHQVIGRLRRAFRDDARNPSYIETLPKRGYRLMARVSVVMPASSTSERLSPKAQPTSLAPKSVGHRPRHRFTLAGLLAAVLTVAVAMWTSSESLLDDIDVPTLAVLPLENLSPDPDEAFFSAAVTREVWSKLAMIEGMRVVSLASSGIYSDSALDIREIGSKLQADFLVEGSAMRSGNLMRVRIHVTDSDTGVEIQGFGFDREIEDTADMFAVFDEITLEIGQALPKTIIGLPVLDLATEPVTTNIAAYNLVQRSLYELMRSGDPNRALPYVEQAVTIDPNSWYVYENLASLKHSVAEFGGGTAKVNLLLARDAINRSVALGGDRFGDTHVTLGLLSSRLDLDFKAAMKSFDRGEQLGANPDYLAGSRQDILLVAGRYEDGYRVTREYVRRNPGLGWPLVLHGRMALNLGLREEGEELFAEAMKRDPENVFILANVIMYYIEWVQELDTAEQILSGLDRGTRAYFDRQAALLEFYKGNPSPLENYLKRGIENRSEEYIRPGDISHDYYLLGDYEQHILWFQRRVEEMDLLGWILFEQRDWPAYEGYWDTLEGWASSDSSLRKDRTELVQGHKALMDAVTEKMVL